MFWTIVLIVLGFLLIPAIVAFSQLPQEDKPSWKVIISVLVVMAILPGVNVLVLFGIVVYVFVKLVNKYLEEDKGNKL